MDCCFCMFGLLIKTCDVGVLSFKGGMPGSVRLRDCETSKLRREVVWRYMCCSGSHASALGSSEEQTVCHASQPPAFRAVKSKISVLTPPRSFQLQTGLKRLRR